MSPTLPLPRHAWIIGDADAAKDLALRLDTGRTVTLWGSNWRPECLLNIARQSFTLMQILEAPDRMLLRAAEAEIARDPAAFYNVFARLVFLTPFMPSLSRDELDAAGICVFTVGFALRTGQRPMPADVRDEAGRIRA